MSIHRVIFITILLAIISTSSFGEQKTDRKSLESYAAGVNAAKIYLNSQEDIELESFLQGIRDQFESKGLRYSDKEVDYAMAGLQAEAKRKSYIDSTMIRGGSRLVTSTFFEQNRKIRGVFATETGLQYKVLRRAASFVPTPSDKDTVEIRYKAFTLNGEKIDESVESAKPVKVKVEYLIPGLKEAVKLMSPTAIWEIYIPQKLTHGCVFLENASQVEDGEPLIYQIELLSISH
jgi:FKBP-type peptidyl-prolyl cis-trans isomerase